MSRYWLAMVRATTQPTMISLADLHEHKVQRIFVTKKQRVFRKSKTFRVIKFYYQFLCIFGCLDYGFFNHEKYKKIFFHKIFMFAQFVAYWIGYFLILDSEYYKFLFFNFLSILFLIYTSVNVLTLLMIDKDKTFFSALIDLQKIDAMLEIDLSYLTDVLIITAIGIYHGVKFILLSVYCFSFQDCESSSFIIIMTLFQQSILVAYSVVFILINWRFKTMLSILKSDVDYHALQKIFKYIVDVAETQKTSFDPMFLISVFYYIPQLLCFIYMQMYPSPEIIVGQVELSLVMQISRLALMVESYLLMLIPALCAGTLASQTRKIKDSLLDHLFKVQRTDPLKAWEIQRFICYVQERDCRFRVYHFIPLDARFIVMVINFCVTYFIVIIQFSNK